jgi:hypothetical protein
MQNQIVTEHETELADMMEERLDIQPSPIMSYQDAIVKKISDKKYLFGYLADDQDAENPLAEWDGVGRIYSAHRDSDTHREMQEALGLNSDWCKDYELVYETEEFRKHWLLLAASHEEFQSWCVENGRPPLETAKLDAYFRNKARRFWRENNGADAPYLYSEDSIWMFEEVCEIAEDAAYNELRDAGKIGDPDAVVLDCYEHGGVAWSVSGEGMNCPFDTAQGGGVWVPDDCTREEIQNRGEKVYAFGHVVKSTRNGYAYKIDQDFGSVESMRFETWGEAYEALQRHIKLHNLKCPAANVQAEALKEKGRSRARTEIARSCVDLYNDYLNGRVFGIVIAKFELNDDGEPEFVEDDAVFGYYGDDDASDSLKAAVEARDD